MTETTKTPGTAKRFGARYGRTTRQTISNLEKAMRSRQKCPYCTKNRVKRTSVGIWNCRNCKATFTGAAYTLKREIKTEQAEVKK